RLVHPILEHVRRAEDQHPPGADRHLLAGLRIAADALALLTHEEASEGRDLHRLAPGERVRNLLQHGFHELCRFVPRQAYLLVDSLAELRTGDSAVGHGYPHDSISKA